MRARTSALLGAAVGGLFSIVTSNFEVIAAERIWTDHIPVGRPYVKPPPPERRLSAEQYAAAQVPPVLPALTPLPADPVREAVLQELTRLKSQATDDRNSELIDQLGSAYGGEVTGPFWITAKGYNKAAHDAVAEMARAGDYAMEPAVFDIPQLDKVAGADTAGLAAGEVRMSLAVMAYAQEAFGARLAPNDISLWLDHKPEVPDPAELLPRVASAQDAAAELRKLNPSHPDFEELRKAYLVVTGRRQQDAPKAPPPIPEGPVLKVGDTDPQVAMVRVRLDVPSETGKDTYFDRELGNEIRNYLRRNGKSRRREINDDLRALLNAPPPPSKMPDLTTIQANMLRWRWMPRDLGSTHIWNNIPEYETRLIKDGTVIHRERIIVGQPDQQTPIFSDKMEHIVFKPQWGVPNSIKISDLLPKLRDGDTNVLERRGMKIVKNGKEVPADRIRWSSVDIRYLNIVQGPSDWNPLGEMKFMFPNRHSVYMHDTTSRHLFSSASRAFSHGCIRVRNPRKLASAIFTEVEGWDAARIPDYLGRQAEENNSVDLAKPIPVHNVYFTLVPDGSGGFRTFRDVYGHDRRIADAIAGKSLRSIANNDPARIHKRRIEEIERSTRFDNSSNSRSQRKRYADGQTVGENGEFTTYRNSLGAGSSRAIRQPRRSRHVAPAWPPTFSFWND